MILAPHLELISLHIPKTAGTSFRNILFRVYGKKAVARFDILKGKIWLDEKEFTGRELPAHIRVIHGHFVYAELAEKLQITPQMKTITWLRNPVERVVSNYYYLADMMKYYMQEEKHHINILSKMQRTLEEYAADPVNRNRMSAFLTGMPLNDFDFVGQIEHFNEHLQQLSATLGWMQQAQLLHYNATAVSAERKQVSAEVLQRIAAWNSEDMALYEAAALLRKNTSQ
jgi:hypothetical protein